jgi:hypothetical protein
MHKKIRLSLGLLGLFSILAGITFQPAGGIRVSYANAVYPDTTFTAPYDVSNSTSYNNTQHPRAVIDPSAYLHVTWMEGTDDPNPKANGPAYVQGQDSAWPAWEWVGPHNNAGYTNPAIARDSTGTIHIVWAASSGGQAPYDIWYATKAPGGSWSAPANLSNEADNTVYPDIAIDSLDRIWVTWQATLSNGDTDIFARSKPAGGSWGAVMSLASSSYQEQNAHIAIDGSDVPHVVWRNNSAAPNWEIYYTRYAGGAWTAPVNISRSSTASHYPHLAAAGSNVYVVWEDEVDGPDRFQALFRRWDGGQWLPALAEPATRVSHSSKILYPMISADNGSLYVAWEDYRGGAHPEIYFSHSTDSGATWLGDENVSQNGTSSYFPTVVAQTGGLAHIFWQDMAPGQLDIYYSMAATVQPTPPHGWVDILAHDPLNDPAYTRLLTVTLQLSATSDLGYPITGMRVCNLGACTPPPVWIPFAQTIPSWSLLGTIYDCEYKWVQARFQDSIGQQSITYTDYIAYDNYLTASMSLNGGNAYTNRFTVTVNSVDRDGQQPNCSGLQDMRLSENGITYTAWSTFVADSNFELAAVGPINRQVYAQYRDRAGNVGTFSDSITLDLTPPHDGTGPTMVSATNHLLVVVSGLEAQDDESGVANVWLANRVGGPWLSLPYCAHPPCSYTWDLAYGGPPVQEPLTHTVYVQYEDASGYGAYPGNFSQVYSGTISVSGISSIFLPAVWKDY